MIFPANCANERTAEVVPMMVDGSAMDANRRDGSVESEESVSPNLGVVSRVLQMEKLFADVGSQLR